MKKYIKFLFLVTLLFSSYSQAKLQKLTQADKVSLYLESMKYLDFSHDGIETYESTFDSQLDLLEKLSKVKGYNNLMSQRNSLLTMDIGVRSGNTVVVKELDKKFLESWSKDLIEYYRLNIKEKKQKEIQLEIQKLVQIESEGHKAIDSRLFLTGMISTIEDRDEKNNFFKKLSTLSHEETLKILTTLLPENPTKKGFDAKRYGLADLNSKAELLKLYRSIYLSEKKLSNLIPLYIFFKTYSNFSMAQIESRIAGTSVSDLDFLVDSASADPAIKELSQGNKSKERNLGNLLNKLVKNIYSHSTKVVQELKSNKRYKLIEMHQYIGIFRGELGRDCATEYSYGYPNSPFEKVFFIQNDRGEYVGYLSGTFVEVAGDKSFYINTVAGMKVSGAMTESIFKAMHQMRDVLGVKNIVVPPSSAVGSHINYQPISSIFNKYNQDNRELEITHLDYKIREVIDRVVSDSDYDSAEENKKGHILEFSEKSRELDIIISRRPYEIKNNSFRSRSVKFAIYMSEEHQEALGLEGETFPFREEAEDIKELFENNERDKISDYIAKTEKFLKKYNLKIEDIEKAVDFDLNIVRLKAEGAFKGRYKEQSIDILLNNKVLLNANWLNIVKENIELLVKSEKFISFIEGHFKLNNDSLGRIYYVIKASESLSVESYRQKIESLFEEYYRVAKNDPELSELSYLNMFLNELTLSRSQIVKVIEILKTAPGTRIGLINLIIRQKELKPEELVYLSDLTSNRSIREALKKHTQVSFTQVTRELKNSKKSKVSVYVKKLKKQYKNLGDIEPEILFSINPEKFILGLVKSPDLKESKYYSAVLDYMAKNIFNFSINGEVYGKLIAYAGVDFYSRPEFDRSLSAIKDLNTEKLERLRFLIENSKKANFANDIVLKFMRDLSNPKFKSTLSKDFYLDLVKILESRPEILNSFGVKNMNVFLVGILDRGQSSAATKLTGRYLRVIRKTNIYEDNEYRHFLFRYKDISKMVLSEHEAIHGKVKAKNLNSESFVSPKQFVDSFDSYTEEISSITIGAIKKKFALGFLNVCSFMGSVCKRNIDEYIDQAFMEKDKIIIESFFKSSFSEDKEYFSEKLEQFINTKAEQLKLDFANVEINTAAKTNDIKQSLDLQAYAYSGLAKANYEKEIEHKHAILEIFMNELEGRVVLKMGTLIDLLKKGYFNFSKTPLADFNNFIFYKNGKPILEVKQFVSEAVFGEFARQYILLANRSFKKEKKSFDIKKLLKGINFIFTYYGENLETHNMLDEAHTKTAFGLLVLSKLDSKLKNSILEGIADSFVNGYSKATVSQKIVMYNYLLSGMRFGFVPEKLFYEIAKDKNRSKSFFVNYLLVVGHEGKVRSSKYIYELAKSSVFSSISSSKEIISDAKAYNYYGMYRNFNNVNVHQGTGYMNDAGVYRVLLGLIKITPKNEMSILISEIKQRTKLKSKTISQRYIVFLKELKQNVVDPEPDGMEESLKIELQKILLTNEEKAHYVVFREIVVQLRETRNVDLMKFSKSVNKIINKKDYRSILGILEEDYNNDINEKIFETFERAVYKNSTDVSLHRLVRDLYIEKYEAEGLTPSRMDFYFSKVKTSGDLEDYIKNVFGYDEYRGGEEDMIENRRHMLPKILKKILELHNTKKRTAKSIFKVMINWGLGEFLDIESEYRYTKTVIDYLYQNNRPDLLATFFKGMGNHSGNHIEEEEKVRKPLRYLLASALLLHNKDVDASIRGRQSGVMTTLRNSYDDYDYASRVVKNYQKAARISDKSKRLAYINKNFKENAYITYKKKKAKQRKNPSRRNKCSLFFAN